MALVLELAPLGGDIRMPALGHPAASELHVALVKRRLELEQEQVLLYVQNGGGHDSVTLAARGGSCLSSGGCLAELCWLHARALAFYAGGRCPLSTSSRCTACPSFTHRTRPCS